MGIKEISTGALNRPEFLAGVLLGCGLQCVRDGFRMRASPTWVSFPTSLKPSPEGAVTPWLAGRGNAPSCLHLLIRSQSLTGDLNPLQPVQRRLWNPALSIIKQKKDSKSYTMGLRHLINTVSVVDPTTVIKWLQLPVKHVEVTETKKKKKTRKLEKFEHIETHVTSMLVIWSLLFNATSLLPPCRKRHTLITPKWLTH